MFIVCPDGTIQVFFKDGKEKINSSLAEEWIKNLEYKEHLIPENFRDLEGNLTVIYPKS